MPTLQIDHQLPVKKSTMNKKNIENIYPLSPTQDGILFHTLYRPESGVYVVQIRCVLAGDINLTAFQQAWQYVIEQHSILRTSFHWEKRDRAFQVVYRQVEFPFQYLDWRNLSPDARQAQLATFLEADRRTGFNLKQAPLMRLTLIRWSEDTYQLIWTKHHLIMDGWSTAITLQQVLETYTALSAGSPPPVITTRPYGDYIAWLKQQDLTQAENFWRKYLQGVDHPTPLGIERHVTPSTPPTYDQQHWRLSPETTQELSTLAQRHQLTVNTLVQGAWAILLSRYSGEADVVFGATVSGRPPSLKGAETMVGLFINTLPVRASYTEETHLLPWLQALQQQQLELREYDYSPLVQVQEWSMISSGMPLFNSIVVFENYPVDPTVDSYSQALGVREVESVEPTNYPLTLMVEQSEQLGFQLLYDANRFSPQSIQRLWGHLQTLLDNIATSPQQRIMDLPILTQEETQQLLIEWNQTQKPVSNCCLHSLFAAQVAKMPDAIAVEYQGQSLTYAELNQKANQLAHFLQDFGIQANSLVGICLDRSLDMIIALLGVLKAGGAYVPLDPAYPAERLAFMLADAEVSLLLTHSTLLSQIPTPTTEVVCFDQLSLPTQPLNNPTVQVTPQDLAYTIYTSGSTGKPKGVQIQHSALVNFLEAMQDRLDINPEDRFLAVTSLSFDIAGLELFLPLLVGSRLIIASREQTQDGGKLAQLLATSEATVMQATPATWRLLLNAHWRGQRGLKMLCGGEALTADLAQALLEGNPDAVLWNLYGPTETTIWSTAGQVSLNDDPISIGSAIANTEIYILNQDLQPVPIGITGELYIGGAGLSLGYRDRPNLTAEKFIPHPFNNNPEARLYRTGDLARYREDGTIECLGRIDHQVKIRGFRIELGEIESLLNQHPKIQASAVIASGERIEDKHLVAYIVPSAEISTPELQTYLRQQLPDYMIPAVFVLLDTLPLNPNGKIDRRGLPTPLQTASDFPFIAPQTEVEQALAQIWSQVLGVEEIGIHDNFFDLGGHSLRATQLVSRLRQTFEIDLPLATLFEKPTLAQLAQVIEDILLAEIDALDEEEVQQLQETTQ
jgi:amino acid adenylation domain-containing protein